ncbi:MAG TPA: ice-binding family protein [Candidatus Saccharimonadales bacterium]|nr:ice-binding family protein [Candidatus Saccharimonadales bacterium]
MKIFTKKKLLLLSVIIFSQLIFMPLLPVYAATTPSLGQAATFAILANTYSNVVGGTTINGDLGYTTGPATIPTVNGTTHVADSTYTQAGIDQNSALSALASQPCTFTFAPGAVDLATDTTHGPIGVYTPGVYCTSSASAASIGAAGITLNGSGTYIFRIDGALTTVANSAVSLAGGASACDVFWTPTAATTLGANTTFAGADIDASGITIGSTVTWTGRALAFGGTVSTTSDIVTAASCVGTTPSPTPLSSSSSLSSNSSANSPSNASSSSNNQPPCIAPVITTIPTIITSKRVSSTSLFVSWGPSAGINTFNVRYGLSNGNWSYNTNVAGFSTTLNDLPANQPIWIQVAAKNNCSIGSYGASQLVGGPALPNTGFAPYKNHFSSNASESFSFFSP